MNSMASLLKEVATQELIRLQRSSQDSAIRKALNRSDQPRYRSTAEQPLIEWTASDEAEFHAWLHREAPPIRRWEEATGFQQWQVGQEFLLISDGELHSMFVPIEGWSVRPRWLGFTPGSGRLRVEQLVTRDPREVWHDAWLLQLGNALVMADRGAQGYAWLKEGLDPSKPENLELLGVLCDALAELR